VTVEISHDEITQVRNLIFELNSEQAGVVVVEGKRDSYALKNLGCSKEILEFHSFCGITKFADSVSDCKNLIILFDSDRKGRYLTRRVIDQLERRAKINLSYKKRLNKIANGRIRAVEEMSKYAEFLGPLAPVGIRTA